MHRRALHVIAVTLCLLLPAWAGRQKGPVGRWVLDSPPNNANAHQVQQMLFLAGATLFAAAEPARVYAELYHGRPDIDNFDTCAIRVETAEGAELLFVMGHCLAVAGGETEIECEHATIFMGGSPGGPRVRHADGRQEEAPRRDSAGSARFRLFTNMLGALEGGETLLCTPDNTRQQTRVINAAHDSCGGPAAIPTEFTHIGDVQYGSRRLPGPFLKGGDDAIGRSYKERKTFSEIGVEWARPGRWVDTTDYDYFPGGRRPQPSGH